MTRSFTNTRFSLDAAFGALGAALSVSALLAKAEAWSALADLDEARLRDIGVTAGQAAREAARPFWDAPKGL